jgi:hypothetical protein
MKNTSSKSGFKMKIGIEKNRIFWLMEALRTWRMMQQGCYDADLMVYPF